MGLQVSLILLTVAWDHSNWHKTEGLRSNIAVGLMTVSLWSHKKWFHHLTPDINLHSHTQEKAWGTFSVDRDENKSWGLGSIGWLPEQPQLVRRELNGIHFTQERREKLSVSALDGSVPGLVGIFSPYAPHFVVCFRLSIILNVLISSTM